MAKPTKPRVLIVDDNKPHCYLLSRMLEKSGYRTDQAHTGKDALKLAAKRPGLILLDVNLPDIDGFEVSRQLHSNPANESIPVVFMSATDVSAPGRIHDSHVKASGFLTQPVEESHLLAVVQGVLSRVDANPAPKPKTRQG